MTVPTATATEAGSCRLMSIGDVAELLGTTTRTLRYYEELGLVSPSRQTVTAQRRYGAEEIERLRRIRELQTLLGLDLEEIGEQLEASDRLEGLRAEYRAGPPPERRDEILFEGLAILERLRERVLDRQERLVSFAEELKGRIGRYQAAMEQQETRARG
jgi:DNA-binding transcriptional MerR regulator